MRTLILDEFGDMPAMWKQIGAGVWGEIGIELLTKDYPDLEDWDEIIIFTIDEAEQLKTFLEEVIGEYNEHLAN